MASVVIKSGVCGFTVRATAQCPDGDHVTLQIESECPNYKEIAEHLHEVEAVKELFVDRHKGLVWTTCATHSPHVSCPVPVGLLKLVEVAAGLALPQSVSIDVRSGTAG
ncbi:MAG TPA: hypothetical protein VME20_11820 [Acidimicrobiales bacterium]|nr:hypothetical protein [Acidimicrobiales bacterium]